MTLRFEVGVRDTGEHSLHLVHKIPNDRLVDDGPGPGLEAFFLDASGLNPCEHHDGDMRKRRNAPKFARENISAHFRQLVLANDHVRHPFTGFANGLQAIGTGTDLASLLFEACLDDEKHLTVTVHEKNFLRHSFAFFRYCTNMPRRASNPCSARKNVA